MPPFWRTRTGQPPWWWKHWWTTIFVPTSRVVAECRRQGWHRPRIVDGMRKVCFACGRW